MRRSRIHSCSNTYCPGRVMSSLIPAAVACLLLVTGCRKPAPPEPVRLDTRLVDGTRAMEEVRRLTDIARRDSGTPGARQAAEHLLSRLQGMNIEAHIDAFEDVGPAGPVMFRNVIAVIPGSGNEWLVLGSHYDTKSGIADPFTGANDSGSSTGLLLELARSLVDHPGLPINILLAFFDGEECVGRYGSSGLAVPILFRPAD